MKIPNELFNEGNYEGTRLIEVTDPRALELNEELKKIQAEANPFIDEMTDLSTPLEPYYAQIRSHEAEAKRLRDEMQPKLDVYMKAVEKCEEFRQKSDLIADKMTPILREFAKPHLREFDKLVKATESKADGKFYIEIIDQIEEKVQQIRAAKAKNGTNS